MFDAFEVPLGEGRILTCEDMFTQTILADCGIPMESEQVAIPMESEQVAIASPRTSGHVAQSLRELKVAEESMSLLSQKTRSYVLNLTLQMLKFTG